MKWPALDKRLLDSKGVSFSKQASSAIWNYVQREHRKLCDDTLRGDTEAPTLPASIPGIGAEMLPHLPFLLDAYQKKRQNIGPRALRRKLREAKDVTIPQADEVGIMCWLARATMITVQK